MKRGYTLIQGCSVGPGACRHLTGDSSRSNGPVYPNSLSVVLYRTVTPEGRRVGSVYACSHVTGLQETYTGVTGTE